MMSLFDEEQIMRVFIADTKKEAAREMQIENAKNFIRMKKYPLEDIAVGTGLTLDEVRELKEEIMPLAKI